MVTGQPFDQISLAYSTMSSIRRDVSRWIPAPPSTVFVEIETTVRLATMGIILESRFANRDRNDPPNIRMDRGSVSQSGPPLSLKRTYISMKGVKDVL